MAQNFITVSYKGIFQKYNTERTSNLDYFYRLLISEFLRFEKISPKNLMVFLLPVETFFWHDQEILILGWTVQKGTKAEQKKNESQNFLN